MLIDPATRNNKAIGSGDARLSEDTGQEVADDASYRVTGEDLSKDGDQ
jgi:hypothetical protein